VVVQLDFLAPPGLGILTQVTFIDRQLLAKFISGGGRCNIDSYLHFEPSGGQVPQRQGRNFAGVLLADFEQGYSFLGLT